MLDITYDAPKPKVIQGAQSDWELVIGLEVHAQVSTKAKLFSEQGDQCLRAGVGHFPFIPGHQQAAAFFVGE